MAIPARARFPLSTVSRTALALLLVAAPLACAPARGPGSGTRVADGPAIRVENESVIHLRIFALRGGQEVRLGRVEGLRTASFRLPAALQGNLQLVARRESLSAEGQGHRSQPFVLLDGQRLVWRIQQSPATVDLPRLSTVSVFGCSPGSGC